MQITNGNMNLTRGYVWWEWWGPQRSLTGSDHWAPLAREMKARGSHVWGLFRVLEQESIFYL